MPGAGVQTPWRIFFPLLYVSINLPCLGGKQVLVFFCYCKMAFLPTADLDL